MQRAFPAAGAQEAGAIVYAVPLLLDPVQALRAAGPVPGCVGGVCVRLVAGFVCGVAARVAGDAAARLVCDVRRSLDLPPEAGLQALVRPVRSPAQDAVAAGSFLVDGVCLCDLSAPRGAEADAREGGA